MLISASLSTAIAYTIIHLCAMGILVLLWRHAPDVVQRILLVVIFMAMSVHLLADVMMLAGIDNRRGGEELFGFDRVWPVRGVAYAFGHAALLIYLVRQWWIKSHICDAVKGRT